MIFIVGAAEHAKVVIDIIEKSAAGTIGGLIDTHRPVGERLCGYDVIGDERVLAERWRAGRVAAAIVAIGDNDTRQRVVETIASLAPDLPFASAVHPAATVARGVTIGAGTVVMAGAVISTDARIGTHCIVNTKASIDHDGVMDDFSSLAPGATVGGRVSIGRRSAVCLGANIVHGVTIGDDTVIGAGALVLEDVVSGVVCYGSPARVVRTRRPGDRYL